MVLGGCSYAFFNVYIFTFFLMRGAGHLDNMLNFINWFNKSIFSLKQHYTVHTILIGIMI